MTHKDILLMASDVGFRLTGVFSVDGGEGFTCSQDSIDKFAKLVAAKEREEILAMSAKKWFRTQHDQDEAIRARGEA
jgi:hypothetical protein